MFLKLFKRNPTKGDAPTTAPTTADVVDETFVTSTLTSESQPMQLNAGEEAMLRALECPVCREPSAPMFQCVNGHSICSDCREDLASCPVCRVPGKSDIHNIALDIISEQVLSAACENKPLGCDVKRMDALGMKMHQDQCPFVYRCAVVCFNTCVFVGRPSELYEHVKREHYNTHVMPLGKEISLTFNDISSFTSTLFKCEDRQEYFNYVVRYDSPQKTFYCYSRYVGPLRNAEKFRIGMKLISTVASSVVLIQCVKQTLSMRDAFEDNMNTITFGKQCFDSTPDSGITIHLTVGPIVEFNSASTQC